MSTFYISTKQAEALFARLERWRPYASKLPAFKTAEKLLKAQEHRRSMTIHAELLKALRTVSYEGTLEKQRVDRRNLKADGRCQYCKKPDAFVVKGTGYCADCQAKQRKRSKTRMRKLRDVAKKFKLCSICIKREPMPGTKWCAVCAERSTVYTNTGVHRRMEKGLCRRCTTKLTEEEKEAGHTQCARHRALAMGYERKSKKKQTEKKKATKKGIAA